MTHSYELRCNVQRLPTQCFGISKRKNTENSQEPFKYVYLKILMSQKLSI